jgi:hypothetical protein
MLHYMIVKKWQISGAIPRYDCESVESNVLEAHKKLEAHKLLNSDKNYTFFVIPFNEKSLKDLKIAS